jgi:uncharacterized membrane protein (DUF106 family)
MDFIILDSLINQGVTPVFGYLDPGLGTMIISAIVGIFATITFAVKGFWYRVTAPLRRKKTTDKKNDAK